MLPSSMPSVARRIGRARHRPRTASVACALAMAVQTVLLYMPARGEGALPPGIDKIGHASMFGGVTVLALFAGWEWLPVLLTAYAPLSELIQGLPEVGRDPDWHDVIADVTGIILALALHRFVVRPRRR